MQPSFDFRIRAMIKALSETVLPAVDPSNKAALEQAHLVMGSLELLRQQIDYAYWLEVADARSMANLVDAIATLAPLHSGAEASAIAAVSRARAATPENRLSDVRECNRKLRDAITALVTETATLSDAAIRSKVETLVLEHAEIQVARERAFVAATRFDVFPDNLLSIEEALRYRPRVEVQTQASL